MTPKPDTPTQQSRQTPENCIGRDTSDRNRNIMNVNDGDDRNGFNEKSPLLQREQTSDLVSNSKTSLNPPSEKLGTVLWRLVPITLVMTMCGCASSVQTQYFSQYVALRYAAIHGANVSGGAVHGSPLCSNASVNKSSEQIAANTDSAALMLKLCLLTGVPALFTTALMGTYADVLGRKAILVVMLCGRLARDTVLCAVVLAHLDINWSLLAYGLDGLLGSFFSFYLANYAYLADITPDKKTRTTAMIVAHACMGAAEAGLGYATGQAIAVFGFSVVSVVPALVNLLSLPLVAFWLENTIQPRGSACMAPWKPLTRMFQFYVVKKRGRNRGLFCLGGLSFILLCLQAMIKIGEFFRMAPPFCWDSKQIGLYAMVQDLSVYMLSVPLSWLLQLCLPVEAVSLVAIMTVVARNLVTALAPSTLFLYLAGAVGFGYGMVFPIIRSLLSCMVEPEEQGALFASLAVVEVCGYLVGTTLSSRMYEATLEFMPGAVYLVLAGYGIAALFLMALFFRITRNMLKKKVASEQCVKA